jgi:hypothetical protein
MRIKTEIKNTNFFLLKGEIKKKNWFNIMQKKKNNQKNENQIGKNHILNWDWMMKLKTNQSFTKRSRTKIKNKKNKDWKGKIKGNV